VWLGDQQLPIDERLTVDAALRQLDFITDELAQIDKLVAEAALTDPDVLRLMTIPGVDLTTAVTMVAVIGDVRRFKTPRHLVGYLGLHPRIRQSGNGPAHHGRLSKEGSAAARHVLVEAAWIAARAPGPLPRSVAWSTRQTRSKPSTANCARRSRPRAASPTEDAARKVIYLAILNAVPHWTRTRTRTRGWTKALLEFKIHFGDRLPD
jgi:transposase